MICIMDRVNDGKNQRDRAIDLLRKEGVARLREFEAAGVTAAAVGRMIEDGEIHRSGRGLYELPDGGAMLGAWHTFAQVAKRVPRGVICLESALAWHEVTDQIPWRICVAVGVGDRAPRGDRPRVEIVRFVDRLLNDSVLNVDIEGVEVKIFDAAKTVADCFRHLRTVGRQIALEGLQETVWKRKATPAEIAEAARRGGVEGLVAPYLEALTADDAWEMRRPAAADEGQWPK